MGVILRVQTASFEDNSTECPPLDTIILSGSTIDHCEQREVPPTMASFPWVKSQNVLWEPKEETNIPNSIERLFPPRTKTLSPSRLTS